MQEQERTASTAFRESASAELPGREVVVPVRRNDSCAEPLCYYEALSIMPILFQKTFEEKLDQKPQESEQEDG